MKSFFIFFSVSRYLKFYIVYNKIIFSLVGSVPKLESVKKAPPKPAWVTIKSSDPKWKKEAQEAECSICMDPLENIGFKKAVYTLRCQHAFHTEVNNKSDIQLFFCANTSIYTL